MRNPLTTISSCTGGADPHFNKLTSDTNNETYAELEEPDAGA